MKSAQPPGAPGLRFGPRGKGLSELPLEPLAGREAVVIDSGDATTIGPERLRGLELSGRPVHSLLLREEVPMVEHLTGLDALPASGACFYALPVKVKAFGTFPVRAFAET